MSSDLHLRHFAGDPDRPALALHCMMGTGSYWRPIAERLDGRIDLRAPDMPGHGRSPAWDPAVQPEGVDYHTALTRQIARLIDRPLDLIGHSLGATIALRIAAGAPEAIRSLTLIEPVLFAAAPDAEQDALFARMGRAWAAGDAVLATAEFLHLWGANAGGDSLPVPDPRFVRQVGIVIETNDALRHDANNILRPGGLEAIDAPVMLIMGGNSPKVIPAIAEALAARLQDVGLATVPGAGHMLPLTHPDPVAGLIAANLDRA